MPQTGVQFIKSDVTIMAYLPHPAPLKKSTWQSPKQSRSPKNATGPVSDQETAVSLCVGFARIELLKRNGKTEGCKYYG